MMPFFLQKYHAVLAFVLVLVIGTVFLNWGLKPLLHYSWQQYQNQNMKIRDLKKMGNQGAYLDSMILSARKLQQEVEEIRTSVPSNNRSSYIHQEILQKAVNSKLTIGEVNMLQEVGHGDYSEYPFEMYLQGDFKSLLLYIDHLEKLNMIVQVRDLIMKTSSLNQNHLKATLQISAFILKSEKKGAGQ